MQFIFFRFQPILSIKVPYARARGIGPEKLDTSG